MHSTQDFKLNLEIQKLNSNSLNQLFYLHNFIPKFYDTLFCEKDGSLQGLIFIHFR